MQKDFHFYLTYALARKAGFKVSDAEVIAWADQYTDELTAGKTEKDGYEIQTQCDKTENWGEKQIQLSVLVPFHFLPGNDASHPWMTTPNSKRSQDLVKAGMANSLIQFGIALHMFQDTFSHQNFSGWREGLNSCFPWYYIESALPNIGHAEMQAVPDVINYTWTDPRSGKVIDNRTRAMDAAKATYDFLMSYPTRQGKAEEWSKIKSVLTRIFNMDSYDKRIDELCLYSGSPKIDFKNVNKRMKKKHEPDFERAASAHLAKAMDTFQNLPW